MKFNRSIAIRFVLLISLVTSLTVLSSRLRADTGSCGGVTITLPFTDVQGNFFFCQIAAAYFSGLTNGTTATTYSPTDPVPREQMAAFTTRTLDQSVKRSHTRAALGEWWTNKSTLFRFLTPTGFHNPRFLACDGQTVWVSNTEGNTVSRIDIKTGDLICTLTGVPSPEQLVIVNGFVFVTSVQSPGKIYYSDIRRVTNQPMVLLKSVGNNPVGITYDGENLWTANNGTGPGTGSLSRARLDFNDTTTFPAGFSQPRGILFDGANLWVTDAGDTTLKRVDTTTGEVLQTIPLSGEVQHPVFDGTNLWIPCAGIAQLSVPDKVYVVRGVGGLTGTVLAQLTGNGLDGAFQAAFDGERICVTNAAAQSVSLWKATDLSPLGFISLINVSEFNPRGICSDGVTFFVGLRDQAGGTGLIARL